MIFFPEMNNGFRNKMFLELFCLMHLKAFGVKKMIIQLLLICLLKGSNFFPRGGIFLPLILKWLFDQDFCLNDFVIIIYCMFDNNMDDNIELYNEKVLIYNVICHKFIGNPIKMVTNHSDIHVEKLTLFVLLEDIWNPLLYILIINQRLIINYRQKLPELINLYAVSINLGVIQQNCINIKHHIQSNDKQHQFNLMCAPYCSFNSPLSFIVFNLFTMVQHNKNFQFYHIDVVTRNGIPSGVCVANILDTKLFTNIPIFAKTVYRWLELFCLLGILVVHLGFTAFAIRYDTIIDSCNTIMALHFLFNVVVNPNLNVLMSSDVQHNDDCHFVVIKSNNGKVILICDENNHTNNNMQHTNKQFMVDNYN